MNQIAAVDVETGEVVEGFKTSRPMEVFVVPSERDEMVEKANHSQRAAEGHHWRTAAMVYAWTYEGTNQYDPESARPKTGRLSISKFADLGIRGLTKRDTVAKYRAAMQRAIDLELCDAPEPGIAVVLPAVEFSHDKLPHNHRAQGTGENEWYTPAKYIEAARKVLGEIGLDPASSDVAQTMVKATSYFTKDDDGLKQDWAGRVWLNPPYSQPEIWEFCKKLVDECTAGNVTEAILLTHNYTDTAWFHHAESIATAICFTRGRIAFEDQNGDTCAPTQGQAFFYFGENVDRFSEVFREFGFVR